MYFYEYGNRDNPTIVFLHGAGATDTFSSQYCLKSKYHIIVPHLYGSGREVDQVYELEKTLVGIVEIVKSLGKEKVSLVGCSLGAELAVALVSLHEELFDKAVFLSAWVCPSDRAIKQYVKLAGIMSYFFKLEWYLRLVGKLWKYTKEQTDFLVAYGKGITPDHFKAWFGIRVRLKEYTGYRDVKIPMLAICGEKELREIRDSLKELGKQNPSCKTEVWEKANHDIPMRFADRLNRTLLDFLSSNQHTIKNNTTV